MVVCDEQAERFASHRLSAFERTKVGAAPRAAFPDRPPVLRSRSVHLALLPVPCIDKSPTPTPRSGRQTYAIILDGQRQPVGDLQADLAGPRGRMPGDVGDSFFRDSVNGDLDGGGQNGEVRYGAHRHRQCRVAEALSLGCLEDTPSLIPGRPLAERADQSQLVERRRAQPVDQASDIRYCGPQLGPQLGGLLLGGRRITLNGHAQGPSLNGQGGELGAEAVMEITAQAPPLLFAGGDEPLARALEIGGEPHRMGGDADLARQVFQETPVSGAECLTGTARSDDQFADRLGLIDERHPDDPRNRYSAAAAGSSGFAPWSMTAA